MKDVRTYGAESAKIVRDGKTHKMSRTRQWQAVAVWVAMVCLAGCGSGGNGGAHLVITTSRSSASTTVTTSTTASQPRGAATPQEAALDFANALEARNAGAHNAAEICALLSSEGVRLAQKEFDKPAGTPCETMYDEEANPNEPRATNISVVSVNRSGDTATVRLHYTAAEEDVSLEDSVTDLRLQEGRWLITD